MLFVYNVVETDADAESHFASSLGYKFSFDMKTAKELYTVLCHENAKSWFAYGPQLSTEALKYVDKLKYLTLTVYNGERWCLAGGFEDDVLDKKFFENGKTLYIRLNKESKLVDALNAKFEHLHGMTPRLF